jgi:hypothetical protein
MGTSLTEFLWEENPKTLAVLFALLLIVGIALFIYDHSCLNAATESTEAKIVDTYQTFQRKIGPQFHVVYEFNLDSNTVKGGQAAPFGKRSKWQEKYHVGDAVKIWYNPDEPSTSYLEKRHMLWSFLFIIVGIAGVVVGIYRDIQLRPWREEQYQKIV